MYTAIAHTYMKLHMHTYMYTTECTTLPLQTAGNTPLALEAARSQYSKYFLYTFIFIKHKTRDQNKIYILYTLGNTCTCST